VLLVHPLVVVAVNISCMCHHILYRRNLAGSCDTFGGAVQDYFYFCRSDNIYIPALLVTSISS
jgi:hypothetical protein